MEHLKAAQHLSRVDPALAKIIANVRLEPIKPHKNCFQALVGEIISQQLSGKVADVIERRFIALFAPKRFPSPEDVLSAHTEKLRKTGMSYQKVAYVKNIASAAKTKQIDFARLRTLADQDVIAELTKIKGIGPWTAEMFLMFTLARPDIFPHGDLGIRNAIIKLYNLRKPPSREKAEALSNPWRPYRTYACRYLWASLEPDNFAQLEKKFT